MAFIYEPISSVWSLLPEPKAIMIDARQTEGLDGFIHEAKNRRLTVVSIHDFGLNPLPSDIVIDGSIAPDLSNFPKLHATFHTGTDYMVLDPVYRLLHQQDKQIGKRVRTVFINLGGGNTGLLYKKILNGLKLWNREIEVLAVKSFSHWHWEQGDFSRNNWNPLHVRWISDHVGIHCYKADLAITTGGIAAYEALCAGTPLMAMSYDRYQQSTIRVLAEKDGCIDLGAGENLNVVELPRILTCFESDRMKRRSFSIKGRQIVDGDGLERVAHILREAIGARSGGSLLEDAG